ncbi:malate dehydrogenase [Chytriomyces confervae]|uniref:malate dehydrogenase n=1 Tax=Chytriomyces confervae TaxID=246404 RepID=A0A507FIP4_9FUNG|nr:malate dehydrogenase [Chytriomyces confervae]
MIALSTLLLILLPLTACHVKVHLHARADNATASSAASDQPKESTAPCVRGNNIGSIYVTQPNISSYVFVGNNAIVEWRYSPNVKNKPKTVDIIVYRESNPTTSQTVIVGGLDVSNGATAWRWHVNQLPAGVYKLHILGKKVAVIGAAGGIGQPLSLLLKLNPNVSSLSLYDLVNTPGVAADLSHINTNSKVKGFKGADSLGEAIAGADVIVIPAGVPRKPGMTRDDLFNTNANIVQSIGKAIAQNAPKAHVLIISNPVNSTVPIIAETLKKAGVFDPRRVFGVTTLDVVRASTFVSDIKGTDASKTKVTVVGGHSGVTIIPLLSQTGINFTQEEIEKLTHRIQYGGDEVVKAKDGTGSATLSMAQAGARFTNSLLEALEGKKGIVEPTYVYSPVAAKDGVAWFSTNVELGVNGVEKIHPLGELSEYEKKLYAEAVPELQKNIKKGEEHANKA